MLQYIIILLDETSTSYCHYENIKTNRKLIDLETLKSGILFAMKENLMIQFVYPDYKLPQEYEEVIESIDHSKIVSSLSEDVSLLGEADVVVYHDWTGLSFGKFEESKSYVLRTSKADLFDRFLLIKEVLSKVTRLNVVITDIESFKEKDFERYKQILHVLSEHLEKLYVEGRSPQLNLLTDRMMLSTMNNCGAGDTNITIAPNGKFYICPAFYLNDESDNVGSITEGLNIKNKQLYRLDHAPICRHCDSYQCKRCIWLNRKTTLEVNTPSHEQCVLSHIERNASKNLLERIRLHGDFLLDISISNIDYLDPFEKRNEWNR